MNRARARLARNVVVLSWVSLFQDVASEMLYPVLPLFLIGELGAGAAVVGVMEGLGEGLAAVLKGVSGRLADRRGRRGLVAAGYGLSTVAKALMGLVGSWPYFLACRLVDRAGKGLRTSPRDALIAADTAPEDRGRAFGFHRAMDTAGAVAGPLIGLALYEALGHRMRPLFWAAVAPALVSTALTGWLREGPRRPKTEDRGGRRGLPRRYWKVLAVTTAFGLANFPDALIIVRMKALGLGFAEVMAAYTLYNVCYAGLSYPAGLLADRWPKPVVYGAGLAVFAVVSAGFGLARSAAWAWPLIALYGAYTALTDGVGKAWVSSLAPEESVGAALGYFQGAGGAARVVAGVWAGLLWGPAGVVPFLISAVVAGVLGVGLVAGAGGMGRSVPLLREQD